MVDQAGGEEVEGCPSRGAPPVGAHTYVEQRAPVSTRTASAPQPQPHTTRSTASCATDVVSVPSPANTDANDSPRPCALTGECWS